MRRELLGEEVKNGEGLVIANVWAAVSADEGRSVSGSWQAIRVGQNETANTLSLVDVDGNRL